MSDAVLIVAIVGMVTLGTVAIAFGRRFSASISPHRAEFGSPQEPGLTRQKASRASSSPKRTSQE